MPIGNRVNISKSPYKDLRELYKVNIFNKSDPFFIDRCFVYQINGVDIPVNSRKSLIFPNITSICGFSCELLGIDINGTVECSCKNPSKSNIGNLVQEVKEKLYDFFYSSSNFVILACEVIIFLIH